MEIFLLRNGTLITWDYEDKIEADGRRINAVPLWKWLMNRYNVSP